MRGAVKRMGAVREDGDGEEVGTRRGWKRRERHTYSVTQN